MKMYVGLSLERQAKSRIQPRQKPMRNKFWNTPLGLYLEELNDAWTQEDWTRSFRRSHNIMELLEERRMINWW